MRQPQSRVERSNDVTPRKRHARNQARPGPEAAPARRPVHYCGTMLMVISTTPVLAGGKLPVKVQR